MSIHGTPRKSPRKHPSPGNGQREPKEVAKWVLEHELQLLTIKVLIFQEYNEKYSHFRGGGLPHYDLICSIFVKTSATGEYGHASTITPPDLDEGDCGFDLNNAVPVIDLLDGDEDKEVEAFKIRLDDMMGEVHSIKDGVSRRSCASSAKMNLVEVAMDKFNEINAELDIPEDSFFQAANYIIDPNRAKMIIRMNDVSRKNWLLKHI
ncbi:hypothetical protein FH972_002126 [Carpinus fangiana]|uniref:Uncharacterized protein n=1 Tax=Carpinus fangiana TaxID=176857 RepID=A0A5N6QGJ7_9ROSI|nr:hypothetical protein FH972_002126 [Carpinus fangiana]